MIRYLPERTYQVYAVRGPKQATAKKELVWIRVHIYDASPDPATEVVPNLSRLRLSECAQIP